MSDGVDVAAMRAEIQREILRVHEDSYGAGARATQVHISQEFVLVVMDIELTPAEQTLLEAGKGETVKSTREAYQQAIAPSFKAIIERSTARRVNSFISSMSLEPLYMIELFRLAESPERP